MHGELLLGLTLALVHAAPKNLIDPEGFIVEQTTARGEWALDQDALAATDGEGLLFLERAASETDDAEVSLIIDLPKGASAGLLLRASYPAHDIEAIHGYRVVVSSKKVLLERMDRGEESVLAQADLPTKFNGRVDASMRGDRIQVRIGKVPLIDVKDSAYRAGRVGLFSPKQRHPPRFRALQMITPTPASEVPRAERVPSGEYRVVVVREDQVSKIKPAQAKLAWRTFATQGPGGGARRAFIWGTRDLDAARKAGVQPVVLSADVPWAALGVVKPAARDYLDAAGVEQEMRTLAADHPDVARIEELGRSRAGRPLLALVIGRAEVPGVPRPAFLFDGAHHGNELMAVTSTLAVARHLLEKRGDDPSVGRIVQDAWVWCVPLMNPDGLDAFFHVSGRAGRKNGADIDGNGRVDPWDGVDLNRNYPFAFGALGEKASRGWPLHRFYRGPSSGSEPETQALLDLARREVFVAGISFHTLSTVFLTPYTVRGRSSPVPDVAMSVATALVKAMPRPPRGMRRFKVAREIYAVDGTSQDSLYHQTGMLAFLLEGRRHNVLSSKERRRIEDEEAHLWRGLIERFLNGPSLSVRIVNAEGGAAEGATFTLAGEVFAEGETWPVRPRDGAVFRYLRERTAVEVAARRGEAQASARFLPGRSVETLVLPPTGSRSPSTEPAATDEPTMPVPGAQSL